MPSLVATGLALWHDLVITIWVALTYWQFLLRKPMIAMPIEGTADRYIELAYAASLATAGVCAGLLAVLLLFEKLWPTRGQLSDRSLVAANIGVSLLLVIEFLVLKDLRERSYFHSVDIPGPEIYLGSALAQMAATITAIVFWRRSK
jgi:hypothetical protein